MRFLEDEFVWFSTSDIATSFEKSKWSYTIAWFMLNDADVNLGAAKHPVPLLKVARAPRSTRPAAAAIQDKSLQADVCFVQSWNEKKQREFQVWADGLFYSMDQNGK